MRNLKMFGTTSELPSGVVVAIERMQGSVTRLVLGIRTDDLRRVRAATGPMDYIPGGGPYWSNGEKELGRYEAEWVLEYCTSAVWEIERRAGPITPEEH